MGTPDSGRPVSPFPPELADRRAAAGAALRNLGHALVGHHATEDELDGLVADLDRWTVTFEANARRNRVAERPTGDWGPPPADGEQMFSYDERPISGRSSPHGLDLQVVRDGDEVVGHVTLRAAHEGAPGRSHGGMISALFDDVFGFLLTIRQQPAFTGELTIRYEVGVPLGVPLECRVRVDDVEGRKLFMTGELTGDTGSGPQVFTRARATFIAIDPEQFGAAGA